MLNFCTSIWRKRWIQFFSFGQATPAKPISLCWLLSTCPTSSSNELRKRVDWTCGCRHPTISLSSPLREEIQLNFSFRIYAGQANTRLNLFHYLQQHWENIIKINTFRSQRINFTLDILNLISWLPHIRSTNILEAYCLMFFNTPYFKRFNSLSLVEDIVLPTQDLHDLSLHHSS